MSRTSIRKPQLQQNPVPLDHTATIFVMRLRARMVGGAALATAVFLSVVHVGAIAGHAVVPVIVVLWTFPVLFVAGLVYIVVVRQRQQSMPPSPVWMRVVWTAAMLYMAANLMGADSESAAAPRSAREPLLSGAMSPLEELREVRDLSVHLAGLLLLPGLGIFAATREGTRATEPTGREV